MLSKTRFLDVILLKDDPIYSALNSEWETERLTLVDKQTIVDLLEKSPDVDILHDATLLLRGLDSVERFISTPSGTSETKERGE